MREDLHEALEKAYPGGFVFLYSDGKGDVRLSGSKMDTSQWLTAFYHIALGLAALCGSDGDFIPTKEN